MQHDYNQLILPVIMFWWEKRLYKAEKSDLPLPKNQKIYDRGFLFGGIFCTFNI